MYSRLFIITILSVTSSLTIAADQWKNSITLQSLIGSYEQSVKRDSIFSGGVIFTGDYLDNGGFSLGLNHSNVKFDVEDNNISQNSIFLSGRYNIFTDDLSGKIILRTDLHYIDNDDVTKNTDMVKAIAPQLTYIPYSGDYSLNFGFAFSSFQNDLSVYQYTPNIGFGFNDKKDWLNIGAYLIYPDNSQRAQGKTSTKAIEATLTHWLGKDGYLPINYLTANILLGERIYAVDNNAGAIYNLANVQENSFSLGCSWDLGNQLSMLTVIGQENFEDVEISDPFSNRYFYINLSKNW